MDSMRSYISFDDLKRNYDATIVDKNVYPLKHDENNNNLTGYDLNNDHLIEQTNQILKENTTKKRSVRDSKKNLKKQKLDLNLTSENNDLLEKFKVKTLAPIKSNENLQQKQDKASKKTNSSIEVQKKDQKKQKPLKRVNSSSEPITIDENKSRVPSADEVLDHLLGNFTDISSQNYYENSLLQLQKWSSQSFQLIKPKITQKIISVSNKKIIVHHETIDNPQNHQKNINPTHIDQNSSHGVQISESKLPFNDYKEPIQLLQPNISNIYSTFDENFLNFNSAYSILKH